MKNFESLDQIEITLNKLLAIVDLLTCVGEKPLLDGTLESLGSELVDIILTLKVEFKKV